MTRKRRRTRNAQPRSWPRSPTSKTRCPALEAEQAAIEKELNDALAQIPNLPAADVPDGKDATANKEHHAHGKKPALNSSKQHFDLGEALGLMDFELAAKLSGSRFVVLKGALARMERAISQFFLDVHTSEFGYTEVAPPLLVRDEVMFGTDSFRSLGTTSSSLRTWRGATSAFTRYCDLDEEIQKERSPRARSSIN